MDNAQESITGTINTVTTPNLKNVEIMERFAAQVESKNPFVFHISAPAEGKDGQLYQQMYIIQKANIAGDNDDVTAMFMGWGGRLYRTIQNSKPHILADMGIQVGKELPNLNIQVSHEFLPQYEKQTARIYGENHASKGQKILSNGKPTFEHTKLVSGTPTHSLKESDTANTGIVTVAQVAEDTSTLEL